MADVDWGDEAHENGGAHSLIVSPVARFVNTERRSRMHKNALDYERIASSNSSVVESIDELQRTVCCKAKCFRDLSWSDYASLRGLLVHLMEDEPSRAGLRKIIISFVKSRLREDVPGNPSDGFIYIDTNICAKNVCLQLFIRILGIGFDLFRSCIISHQSGEPLVSSTSSGKNYLRLNTIQAIARISVEISTIGQFNPTDGHIILHRAVNKHSFSRSNENGAFLPQRLIKMFVGQGTRKRGAIDFLTCAICRTLSAQMTKLESISAIMRSELGRYVPSVRKTVPEMIAKNLVECRKSVLMNVHQKFKTAATKLAKTRKVDRLTIRPEEVVCDEDVEDDAYLEYLNGAWKLIVCVLNEALTECDGVSITLDAVIESESFVSADFETSYVQQLARARKLDVLECSSVDEIFRMNSKISTSAVQLRSLMNVHNEHVTHERLVVQVANEMCAKYPNQVLALQFDGCGKDKTKLPCIVNKDKDTHPAEAIMCPLFTWQLAVPSTNPKSVAQFQFKNFDYIIPFTWCGTMSTDVLISTLIDLLLHRIETQIPPIISIVFDNANSNKSVGTLRALAAVMELVPSLREMHLYFPSVGHTHGSVDQHFSSVSKRMRSENVLTVQDLLRVVQGDDENTIPITKFAMYEVVKRLERNCGGTAFKNISDQHYFLLFKNSYDEVVFNYDAFLRFAEPLSARVQYHMRSTRALLPLTDIEKKNGVHIFSSSICGAKNREKLFRKILPSIPARRLLDAERNKLMHLLPPVYRSDPRIRAELDRTSTLLLRDDELVTPLLDALTSISTKCSTVDNQSAIGTTGNFDTSEEERIGQHMRLLGKRLKTSSLAVDLRETCKSFRREVIAEVLDILETVDEEVKSRYVDAVAQYSFDGLRTALKKGHQLYANKLQRELRDVDDSERSKKNKKKKKSGGASSATRNVRNKSPSSDDGGGDAGGESGGDDDDDDAGGGRYLVPPAKMKFDRKAAKGASRGSQDVSTVSGTHRGQLAMRGPSVAISPRGGIPLRVPSAARGTSVSSPRDARPLRVPMTARGAASSRGGGGGGGGGVKRGQHSARGATNVPSRGATTNRGQPSARGATNVPSRGATTKRGQPSARGATNVPSRGATTKRGRHSARDASFGLTRGESVQRSDSRESLSPPPPSPARAATTSFLGGRNGGLSGMVKEEPESPLLPLRGGQRGRADTRAVERGVGSSRSQRNSSQQTTKASQSRDVRNVALSTMVKEESVSPPRMLTVSGVDSILNLSRLARGNGKSDFDASFMTSGKRTRSGMEYSAPPEEPCSSQGEGGEAVRNLEEESLAPVLDAGGGAALFIPSPTPISRRRRRMDDDGANAAIADDEPEVGAKKKK